jgi:hypothetical protein
MVFSVVMAVLSNDGENKMEGKFPSRLQAGICGGFCVFWWFGLKPNFETQRFVTGVRAYRALDRTVSGVFR